jgi:hypothetical protein
MKGPPLSEQQWTQVRLTGRDVVQSIRGFSSGPSSANCHCSTLLVDVVINPCRSLGVVQPSVCVEKSIRSEMTEPLWDKFDLKVWHKYTTFALFNWCSEYEQIWSVSINYICGPVSTKVVEGWSLK